MRDCTDYSDRDTPGRDEMEKMPLLIEPATSSKCAGFRMKAADELEDQTAEVARV